VFDDRKNVAALNLSALNAQSIKMRNPACLILINMHTSMKKPGVLSL